MSTPPSRTLGRHRMTQITPANSTTNGAAAGWMAAARAVKNPADARYPPLRNGERMRLTCTRMAAPTSTSDAAGANGFSTVA